MRHSFAPHSRPCLRSSARINWSRPSPDWLSIYVSWFSVQFFSPSLTMVLYTSNNSLLYAHRGALHTGSTSWTSSYCSSASSSLFALPSLWQCKRRLIWHSKVSRMRIVSSIVWLHFTLAIKLDRARNEIDNNFAKDLRSAESSEDKDKLSASKSWLHSKASIHMFACQLQAPKECHQANALNQILPHPKPQPSLWMFPKELLTMESWEQIEAWIICRWSKIQYLAVLCTQWIQATTITATFLRKTWTRRCMVTSKWFLREQRTTSTQRPKKKNT